MAELATTDDFRCSVWTAAQGFDPVGSATTFDRLVTVEVPQPWPAEIEELHWIAPLDVAEGTRVQAIVAEVGRSDGSVLLTRWERSGAKLVGVDWFVPAGAVPAALALLVSGAQPDGSDMHSEGTVSKAPPEVLICGHGTRDRCCGGAGTRLTIEARAELAEFRVRRTSHLGGHRFAPTALTLPDGRMWAFLDVDALAGIVGRTIPSAEAREFYRGNVALDPWAQVVEAAVLTSAGWPGVDFEELRGSADVDGDRATVDLSWTAGGLSDQRSAQVEIVTRYPVLQCGLAPEEATKGSAEYRLV